MGTVIKWEFTAIRDYLKKKKKSNRLLRLHASVSTSYDLRYRLFLYPSDISQFLVCFAQMANALRTDNTLLLSSTTLPFITITDPAQALN